MADSLAQIQQAAEKAQQERIRQLGAIRTQNAVAPGDALQNALNQYMGARKYFSEENAAKSKQALEGAQTNLLGIQGRTAEAEENANNALDTNSGLSNRLAEKSMHLKGEQSDINVAQQSADTQKLQVKNQYAAEMAKYGLESKQFMDAHTSTLHDEMMRDIDGATNIPDPQARAKRFQEISNQYTQQGLSPQTVSSAVTFGAASKAKLDAQTKKANDQLFYLSDPTGVALQNSVKDTVGDNTYLNGLKSAQDKFKQNVYVPGVGIGTNLNENTAAMAARKAAANLMIQSGDAKDAAAGRMLLDDGTSWEDANKIIQDTLDSGTSRLANSWQTIKSGIPPKYTDPNSPDYKETVGSTENMVQQTLKKLSNKPVPANTPDQAGTVDLTRRGGAAPPSGAAGGPPPAGAQAQAPALPPATAQALQQKKAAAAAAQDAAAPGTATAEPSEQETPPIQPEPSDLMGGEE
jgi:hypothetical protein